MSIVRAAVLGLAVGMAVNPAATVKQPVERERPVEVQARNLNLRMPPDIVFEIRSLRGHMQAVKHGEPVTFDDPASFDLHAAFAEIALSPSSLEHILNQYAFAYEGAPLKNLRVSISGDALRIQGTMHKGVDLPFTIEGRPEPDGRGQIRVHAHKVTSAHLPLKGLLHLFGKDLADLVNTNEARGVRIEGDDIILFPSRLTPAPHIAGEVTQVRVVGNRVVEVFGAKGTVPDLAPPRKAKNYIYHRGGILRFGKLTMTDADLELIDLNQRDPFEFYLAKYNQQLVAGYSKNTPSYGLIVFMPDYGRLPRGK